MSESNDGVHPRSNAAYALGWLADHGDALYSYAFSRLRDRNLAEELVQDTFLSALRSYESFRADAEVLTWLIGILRHKILDHYRSQARRDRLTSAEGDYVQQCFNQSGKLQRVSRWSSSVTERLDRQEFQQVLDQCLEKLGGMLSQVFILRVMDDRNAAEVCTLLDISPSNLSVRLHRARLGLRDCLERHWFGKDSA